MWAEYFRNKIDSATKYSVIADSGLFLDTPNILSGKNDSRLWYQNILSIANSEVGVPS